MIRLRREVAHGIEEEAIYQLRFDERRQRERMVDQNLDALTAREVGDEQGAFPPADRVAVAGAQQAGARKPLPAIVILSGSARWQQTKSRKTSPFYPMKSVSICIIGAVATNFVAGLSALMFVRKVCHSAIKAAGCGLSAIKAARTP